MNPETRFSGHWIVAAQGTGKTNLLLHMLASDLEKDAAIIIMDSKGDLTAPIRNLALGERLVVLDHRQPFAINPLDVPKTDIRRAVNHLEYIFGALLEANVTPMQKALLRSILRAVIMTFTNPTLQTIQDIVTNGPSRYKEYIDRLPPDLQDFFTTEWKDYDRTRGELKWRLRLVLENDLIRKMFNAPRTRFRIGDAMDRGDVVVIDNAQEHLHEDGSAFLGRFFLAQIWAAATARSSRPRHEKKPVFVYIDECHTIIKQDPIIATIIDMCRSQNIALVLSHQRSKQIDEPNVLSALENCAIKMANVDAEAKYFSELLHIPQERMNRLPRGHFAMHVRGEGSSIVEIPLAEFPYETMTQKEKDALQQRMKRLYGIEEPETHQPNTDETQKKIIIYKDGRDELAKAKLLSEEVPPPRLFPDTHEGPSKPEPSGAGAHLRGQVQPPVADANRPIVHPPADDPSKPSPWKRK